jgi:phage shock protein A
MGLGSTAKKLQKVADVAEDVYARLNEVRSTLADVEDTIDDTHGRVEDLERRVAEQRELLEALAAREGVDVEAALESVETDATSDEGADAERDDDADVQASDDAPPL